MAWPSLMIPALLCLALAALTVRGELQLQVVTIATEETDGFKRFMRSADLFDLNVRVVGMGREWRGGDVVRLPGGGQKVNLLKPVVEEWKEREDLVVMFVDSYDVILTAGAETILSKFAEFGSRVVFSAEGFCWPDQNLANQYPRVGLGKRFLNSGGFIGYAREIHQLVWDHAIADSDDDQLYYTQLFLDHDKRVALGMRLDHRAHIFQNLNGAKDEVELVFTENGTHVYNTIFETRAVVYHGNGPSKIFLGYLGNYIPGMWNQETGCTECTAAALPSNDEANWPTVLLAVFVERETPFLAEALASLAQLSYPRSRLSLWVHNAVAYHEPLVGAWYQLVSGDYASCHYTSSEGGVSEETAKSSAVAACEESGCGFLFLVDSLAMLDRATTLQELVALDRSVVAPLLQRPGLLYSNFWGDVASNGFYSRSHDYQLIVGQQRIGVWNVAFVSAAVLLKGAWLRGQGEPPLFYSEDFDSDMTFAAWMREKGNFMYVSNLEEYGHLINADDYDTSHLHNDMFSLFDNRVDWERRYIHENWSRVLEDGYQVEQPCPDVYTFPLISETFARELVEEMEFFGQWSGGRNEDGRLDGGYENVPTRDIHMTQVGLQEHWLDVIKSYIVPMQLKVFPGYFSKAESYLNFVVKYHPQGQDRLQPHHDASTFTTNIALSTPHVDFEGGGCRFLRYNCSVVDLAQGWTLLHPGRLTHYHEGLTTTQGTRYIMVSFIDP